MATLEQLQTALVNADKAGDTAAATALANAIQQQQAAPPSADATPAGPQKISQYQEAPNFGERLGRGFMDVGQGLKQLYLMATDKPDLSSTVSGETEAQRYTREKNQENDIYTAGRGGPEAHWYSDPARLLGNVLGGTAVAAPIAAALPEAATAGVLGRVATQAGLGAAQGAANFEPSGTWGGKALQTGAGAVGGGVVQGGVEALAPVAGRIAARVAQGATAVKNRVSGATDQMGVSDEMRRAIPQFDEMPLAQQQSIIDRVISTRGAGKDVTDPAALARQADAESLGMGLTKGQATRNPNEFYAEQEASKLRGVGDPLQDTFIAQNQQLLGKIPALQQGTGGTAATPYEAAENARRGVQAWQKGEQAKVGQAYDAALTAPGADMPINGKPLFDRLPSILDTFEDVIPAPVKQRLAELSMGASGGAAKRAGGQATNINPNADDIITAIRKAGGINPGDESIGSLAKHYDFPPDPRNGPVWRQPTGDGATGTVTGHSPDRMAETLYQHGYLESRDAIPEMMSKIEDQAIVGKQHFSAFHEVGTQDPLTNAIDRLTKSLDAKREPMPSKARDFTVPEVDKLTKLINARMSDSSDGATRAAGRQIKDALEASIQATQGDTGASVGMLRGAVAKARQNFAAQEPAPISRLLDVKEAAPNFLQTNVLGGKPGELASLKAVLPEQAWNDIRSQTLQHLADKATMGDAQGLFSGARFGKALNDIGMDRLRVLFSPQELNTLGAIKRTAHAVTVAPPRSNINNSNTASTLANLLQSQAAGPGAMGRLLSIIPGAGPAAVGAYQAGRQALQQNALRGAARQAAAPGAAAFSAPALAVPDARQLLAKLLMRPGAAFAAPAAMGMLSGGRSGQSEP